MKKIFLVLVLGILLTGIVLAQQTGQNGDNQGMQTNTGTQNQIKAGNYVGPNGEQIQVQEKANNQLKIKVGNVEADCSCNLTQEQVQNKTKLKVQLSNGKNAEVKIMPDVAAERAIERLRLKVCSTENNCTLELKEVGKGEQAQLAYEIQIERHSRILGIFQAKMRTKTQVDAENGEIIKVQKPWWAFLASEPEE